MPKTQSKIHIDNDIPLRPLIIRHIPLGAHINVTGKEWYHINTLYPFKVLQLYIYIYIYIYLVAIKDFSSTKIEAKKLMIILTTWSVTIQL